MISLVILMQFYISFLLLRLLQLIFVISYNHYYYISFSVIEHKVGEQNYKFKQLSRVSKGDNNTHKF